MNRVTLVLDASGSMSDCYKEMLKNVKNMLDAIKQNDIKFNQKTTVTLLTFDNNVKTLFKNRESKSLGSFDYRLGGSTALFDATGEAVEAMLSGESYLVVVFTDGYENASVRYNAEKIKKLIKDKQKTGLWTFAFNVPPGNKKYFEGFGIPSDNIREWESTEKSLKETEVVNLSGLNTYYQARSTGKTSVSNFYTDLSQLKVGEVRKELDNISNNFKQIEVKNEAQIRDVVQSNGINYVKGNTFYQLVKPELIQENKELLVMEKGKKAIWGGEDARNLLGVPKGRIKVYPGNHGKFEIFVQSTSVNRKTVPGTKLLVRK